jgi:hypothetical protein
MRVQSGSGIVRSQPTASRAQSSIHQYAMTAASHADGLFNGNLKLRTRSGDSW